MATAEAAAAANAARRMRNMISHPSVSGSNECAGAVELDGVEGSALD
jgi:hypothetical protein